MKKRWFKSEIQYNILIDGFVMGVIPAGEDGIVLRKGLVTSFEARFYSYVTSLCNVFNINTNFINNLLIVIDSSNSAKIYKEMFPISLTIKAKSDLKKFSLVYNKDILELNEVTFQDSQFNINPVQNEKVIWLFRNGFSFGLYFDLSGTLIPEVAKREMALLFQRVIFFDLYNNIEADLMTKLIENGWFPFIQVIGEDHVSLFLYIKENKINLIDDWCNSTFSDERIKDITKKWFSNNVFNQRNKPLSEGLNCFYCQMYAAAISSLIPMIEGIANNFILRTTGKGIGYSGDDAINQIEMLSRMKYNEESLFLIEYFKRYLKKYYFKHNTSSESDNAVRNTISHGRATNESFTRTNAIKIILTLDQLYYFI